MSQEPDDLELGPGPAPLTAERERDFEAWVRRRLSEWSSTEIRAFDHWLLDEMNLEFVPAVRAAWRQKRLEEWDPLDSTEPAA